VKRVKESLKINEEDARKEIARFDEGSCEFVKRYFKANIADPINYDIVINTSHVNIEGAASIIVDSIPLFRI
jgi:cytidylate kinase